MSFIAAGARARISGGSVLAHAVWRSEHVSSVPSHSPFAPPSLPVRQRAVIRGPGLRRDLVVPTPCGDELLQVGHGPPQPAIPFEQWLKDNTASGDFGSVPQRL